MTTFVPEAGLLLIGLSDFEAFTRTYGIVTIGLLVVLLVGKEFIRAYWQERAESWLLALNMAIVPLLATFALIMAVRLWRLLQIAGLI